MGNEDVAAAAGAPLGAGVGLREARGAEGVACWAGGAFTAKAQRTQGPGGFLASWRFMLHQSETWRQEAVEGGWPGRKGLLAPAWFCGYNGFRW